MTARRPRVAFQGARGAYSEDAVREYFGGGAEPVPQREFRSVGDAVEAGDVDFGLLPVENTLAGSVLPSFDVLAREGLDVVGEVITAIHHCVHGLEGSTLHGLRRVLSHPVALAQCEKFLVAHPWIVPVAVYDTAGAAQQVVAEGDVEVAAIASRNAGARYGLTLLAENVEDRPDNQTRFLIVSRQGVSVPGGPRAAGSARRTTLLLETANVPGALLRVLEPFAARGINLSKLESRPGTEPWSYRFFVDLDADRADPETEAALADARCRASLLRVLGSYARWTGLTR